MRNNALSANSAHRAARRAGHPVFLYLLLATAAPWAVAQEAIEDHKAETVSFSTRALKMVRVPEVETARIQGTTPRRHVSTGDQWVRLIDQAAQGEQFDDDTRCAPDALGRDNPLCEVRWRKTDAVTRLRSEYASVNKKVKSGVFGKSLAQYIDLDLDSSPEIRIKIDFD